MPIKSAVPLAQAAPSVKEQEARWSRSLPIENNATAGVLMLFCMQRILTDLRSVVLVIEGQVVREDLLDTSECCLHPSEDCLE